MGFIAPHPARVTVEELELLQGRGSSGEEREDGHAHTLALAPGPDLTGISGWQGVRVHPLLEDEAQK